MKAIVSWKYVVLSAYIHFLRFKVNSLMMHLKALGKKKNMNKQHSPNIRCEEIIKMGLETN